MIVFAHVLHAPGAMGSIHPHSAADSFPMLPICIPAGSGHGLGGPPLNVIPKNDAGMTSEGAPASAGTLVSLGASVAASAPSGLASLAPSSAGAPSVASTPASCVCRPPRIAPSSIAEGAVVASSPQC